MDGQERRASPLCDGFDAVVDARHREHRAPHPRRARGRVRRRDRRRARATRSRRGRPRLRHAHAAAPLPSPGPQAHRRPQRSCGRPVEPPARLHPHSRRTTPVIDAVERLEVGIPGFDEVAQGGIPAARSTLVAGTAGSGKTLLGVQYLVSGIERYGQNAVLVTFDEPGAEIARNVGSFGWDLHAYCEEGRMAIVDVSSVAGEEVVEAGNFDFDGLLARLDVAIERTQAKRLVFDSLTGVFPQFVDRNVVRRELHKVTSRLRSLGVTTLMTAERSEEYGPVARYGVEEFVTDNVIILRHPLARERRRRTLELLKFRGATHSKGEYPFSIDGRAGITVIPLAETDLKTRALTERTSIGKQQVNDMCGGGIFRDSIVLVSGATGTGKTMMVTEFLSA